MADTIVRLFDRPADALRAVRRLEALGINDDDISLVANNREGWYDKDGVRHERLAGDDRGHKKGMKDDDLDGEDDRLEGAGDGAMTGGVIGGILGALTHEGVDRKDAEVYAESIRRGGAVVVVRNHGDRRREIEQALSDYSTDATVRGDYYRSSGWNGYDERAADWDETQIAADREAARNYRPTTLM